MRFSASYMMPEIATVRCVVERTERRSVPMRVLVPANFGGGPARISLPLTNPRQAVIAVFVVAAAHHWGLGRKMEN